MHMNERSFWGYSRFGIFLIYYPILMGLEGSDILRFAF